VRERLEELRDRTGAESITEVVRRAVALYDTLLSESDVKGTRLVLRDAKGNERDLLMARDIV
jgi:hypothetical protein